MNHAPTQRNRNTLTGTALMAIIALSAPLASIQAQVRPVTNCGRFGLECGTGSPGTDISNIILSVVYIALGLTAAIAFGALVYYGILFVISRGEEENIRKAKRGIAYAIIGLFVIGLSGFIINAIINL